MLLDFEYYGQRGMKFLKKLAKEIKILEEPGYPEKLMTAFLYTLREMNTLEQSQELLSILPMHFKGIYAHGWRLISEPVKANTLDEFLTVLRSKYQGITGRKFVEGDAVRHHISAILGLLRQEALRASGKDIRTLIPDILHELLPEQEETAVPDTK